MNDETSASILRAGASCRPAPPASARAPRRRCCSYARAQSKRIVVRDDGGVYTKAYGECFYKPFTQKTGIEVVGVQANAEPVAQIKSMVDTKNYTWDMAKISQPAILLLTEGGKVYLEKHGLESDPNVKTIPAHFMSPVRRRHQRLRHRARLPHRRVQGPQGARLLGRPLEREGLPGPPRDPQASVRHARGVADGRAACRPRSSIRSTSTARSPNLDQHQAQRRRVVELGRAGDAAAELGRGRHDRHLGLAPAAGHHGRRAGGDRLEPEPVGRRQLVDPGRHAERRRLPRVHQVRVRREAHGAAGRLLSRRRDAARGVQVHEARDREALARRIRTTSRPACRSTPSTGSRTRPR